MKVWNDFLDHLEKDLGKETVDKWLRSLKILKFDAANLYLDAKDSFQVLWYKEHITKELKSSNGKPIKLHFTLNGEPYVARRKKELLVEPETKQHFSSDHLASHATFEHTITKETPFLPYDLLSNIDGSYNPIFLYGPSGSGKTHLLTAAAHKLKQEKKNVFYVRSETFTEHVIRAFRTTSLQEFRLAYRDLDCLIIDDVHLFKKKKSTQEELFHTFNRLHTQGKQIILSANAYPHLLEGIEERLKSRFEWGIALPLQPVELQTKKKIVQMRATILSLSLTEILIAFLLETFQSLTTLMRALEALALRLHQSQLNLDIQTANHLLKDLILDENTKRLSPEKILSSVAAHFRTKIEDILGRSQSKECVLPRKIAMYFCRNELRMSYLKIGELFSRDHSTVMSSVKNIEKRKNCRDEVIGSYLIKIKQLLSQ